MLDWHGSGMGVMEMSHRGQEFVAIYEQAEADLRELLAVPARLPHPVHAGRRPRRKRHRADEPVARAPRRLRASPALVRRSRTRKRSATAMRDVAASNAASGHTAHARRRPAGSSAPDAAYVHVCSNETIHGVEFHACPTWRALGSDAPLVIDCSSHVASRPIDWSRVGAGLRRRAEEHRPGRPHARHRARRPARPCAAASARAPSTTRWWPTTRLHVQHAADLGDLHRRADFQWIKPAEGGVAAMEQRNVAKAALLYDYIDGSRLLREQGRHGLPFAHERAVLPARRTPQRRLPGRRARRAACCSSRATSPSAACAPASTTRCRSQGVQALVGYMREFARTPWLIPRRPVPASIRPCWTLRAPDRRASTASCSTC